MNTRSKEGRTYAIVKFTPAWSHAQFADFKQDGVIETRLETVRKSLDGKQAILKWRGVSPKKLQGIVQWSGTHEEILEYLESNVTAWEGKNPWDK